MKKTEINFLCTVTTITYSNTDCNDSLDLCNLKQCIYELSE